MHLFIPKSLDEFVKWKPDPKKSIQLLRAGDGSCLIYYGSRYLGYVDRCANKNLPWVVLDKQETNRKTVAATSPRLVRRRVSCSRKKRTTPNESEGSR